MRQCSVYIMASRSRTLYGGVTGDLPRRILQHKNGLVPGFTTRCRIDRLVHVVSTTDVRAAIAREKQIKGWTRRRKLDLIATGNPGWADLSREWTPADPSLRSG